MERGFVLLCALVAPVAGAEPKVIDLTGADKPALDVTEQAATDAALVMGATDVAAPVRIITRDHHIHQEVLLQPGRCYVLSVMAAASWAMDAWYSFEPTLDGKPVADGHPNGHVRTKSGGGTMQVCTDRVGTIKFGAAFDANSQDFHGQSEFAFVVGWRAETPAQFDARHRCLNTPRKDMGDC